jgi:bifunctional DNA-binding transcriptional regulator/antitoxin component of YhaV-PrlF toxin-antitoxin module
LEDRKDEGEYAFTVYLRREGRVTVPKELRDVLNLEEGCLVECRIKKIR